ncbi:hypothetical protein EG829_30575, partial [bacterium]|nr:hypothetical protein [bacterium]
RRCKESPSIFTLTNSRLETLEKSNGGYRAVITKSTPVIDPELCICCGRCESACPKGIARPHLGARLPARLPHRQEPLRRLPHLRRCVPHKGHRLRTRRGKVGTGRGRGHLVGRIHRGEPGAAEGIWLGNASGHPHVT